MQRIISRTPVRISFFGGGTDYPAYYLRHRGATLGTTINQYTYVSLNTLPPLFDYTLRLSYSKVELVKTIEEIQHPSIRHCLHHHGLRLPLDIHISADLPARTGLGSSSAFTVGFLNALHALQGRYPSKQKLAEEALYVEQKLIQENVGSQDQFHAAVGGFNVMEFSTHGVQLRPLLLSHIKKRLFEKHLLLFFTGITRTASDLLQEQIERTQKQENDPHLQRMAEMVFEAEEILSQGKEEEIMPLLGILLQKGWQLKKQLSSKISNPLIDHYYQSALQAGAYGGKLCGAGGGGFLALLVPESAQCAVRAALQELPEIHCRFENEGTQIIYQSMTE